MSCPKAKHLTPRGLAFRVFKKQITFFVRESEPLHWLKVFVGAHCHSRDMSESLDYRETKLSGLRRVVGLGVPFGALGDSWRHLVSFSVSFPF
jgi:hypothetical protein